MRRPFVAGNWKMNMTLAQARNLMAGLREQIPAHAPLDLAVCPPFPLLFPLQEELGQTGIRIGAQNCYFEEAGAYTGEVSPGMVKDTNATYVIIGHSERRHILGETFAMLKKKVAAAQTAGLHVIYCIGETLEQREANQTEAVLAGQIEESLSADLDTGLLTIAYEPVWAIGTGRNASAQQAQDAHAFVRTCLKKMYNASQAEAMRIQYGGSVKPSNAEELMSQPDVDGALVGGASLKAADFVGIINGTIKAKNL
jgi:triosephosphate isomerase (TIM)